MLIESLRGQGWIGVWQINKKSKWLRLTKSLIGWLKVIRGQGCLGS